ncbi:hypothetical protein FB45DRAFT_1006179 [Roridomyces roridus]|uniref:Uncharacterized protein n=1 Tax=Roridomyces roridus TaxID=1738132 RepID=A0AAD7BIF1_9AGAR|nr:hypothetical protein FB45DRAFT_1006179 [Roridomyces roridus]
MFHDTIYCEIPRLTVMLKHHKSVIRNSVGHLFCVFANHPIFQVASASLRLALGAQVAAIIHMIHDEKDEEIRNSVVGVFKRAAANPNLHYAIVPEIPLFFWMVRDSDIACRQIEIFHTAIRAAIPAVIGMLQDEREGVRNSGTRLFRKLVAHEALHDELRAQISRVVLIMEIDRWNTDIRAYAGRFLEKACANPTFSDEMTIELPRILAMVQAARTEGSFSDFRQDVRPCAFQHAVEAEIPRILEMFQHEHVQVRAWAVALFVRLGALPQYDDAMKTSIPTLVKMVGNRIGGCRECAAEAIESIAASESAIER